MLHMVSDWTDFNTLCKKKGRNPEGNRLLDKHSFRWDDNAKVNVTQDKIVVFI